MTVRPSHREGRIFILRTAQNNHEQTVKSALVDDRAVCLK